MGRRLDLSIGGFLMSKLIHVQLAREGNKCYK